MNLLSLARKYSAHSFLRSVTALQGGVIAATFVQSVAGILLARILGPHEYGRFAIVMSLASIASSVLGAGVVDAMAPSLMRVLGDHQGDERRRILYFIGRFVFLSSCVALAIGLLLPTVAELLYHDRGIGWAAYIVVGAAAISSLALAPTQLVLQVRSSITGLALVSFADQFIRQLGVVGLAALGLGVLGAATGHAIGACIVFIVCSVAWRFHHAPWSMVSSLHEAWWRGSAREREYVKPTLWVLLDRNLAMVFGAAPIAIAALYLTTIDISYFKIAFGWVLLALSLLGPVTTLLNTELTKISQQGVDALRRAFVKITCISTAASLLLAGAAAVMARPLFEMLYGSQYVDAAKIVWWLLPFGVLYGSGVALGPMWRLLLKVKVSLRINIIVLCIGVPLAMAGLSLWGIGGAVVMVTGWYGCSHAISIWYLLRLLGKMQTL